DRYRSHRRPRRSDATGDLRALAPRPAAGGRTGARPPRHPASRFPTSEGPQGRWSGQRPCRRRPSHLSRRPGRSGRHSRLAGPVLGGEPQVVSDGSRSRSGEETMSPARPRAAVATPTVAPIHAEIDVAVPPAKAFEVFTARMTDWWP